eukprot:6189257-Pleurochrysis_carterae.AAC.1
MTCRLARSRAHAPSGRMRSTQHSVALPPQAILVDFFRYAFDGSGADNFFDAGNAAQSAHSAALPSREARGEVEEGRGQPDRMESLEAC